MNSMPIPLEVGYTAEFDTVDKDEWYKILDQFLDALFVITAYDNAGNESAFSTEVSKSIF